MVAVHRQRDADARRPRMALDVAKRLGSGPVDEALGLVAEVDSGLNRQLRVDPARLQRGEQVREGRFQPARAEVRWVDLDEERPQLPHRVTRPRGRPLERLPRRGRRLGLGGCAERVREPGEILDGAVVQLRGDPPPLVGGRLDRVHEKCLAGLLRPAQSPVEAPRQRHLDEPQEREAREQEGCERHPDAPSGGRNGARALVRLEEQRRPVRRADGEVDLVEAPLALLEAVLGAREIAQLGPCAAGAEHVELRLVERVAGADQPRLVGVEDAAVARPELDADDALAEDALLDDPVDGRDRLAVAAEEAGRDRRLDDALARERRELACVAERLRVPEAPQREQGTGAEHREHGEAGERELGDGVLHSVERWSATKVPLSPGPAPRHPPRRSEQSRAKGDGDEEDGMDRGGRDRGGDAGARARGAREGRGRAGRGNVHEGEQLEAEAEP